LCNHLSFQRQPEFDAFPATADLSPSSVMPSITINITGTSSSQVGPSVPSFGAPALLPLTSLTHANFPHDPNPQPLLPKYQGQPMTPAQLAKWNALLAKYGESHVHKHQWEWIHGDFLIYQSVNRITDYWTEWSEGIGGFLPTREMTDGGDVTNVLKSISTMWHERAARAVCWHA
jgi:hypothetical protein